MVRLSIQAQLTQSWQDHGVLHRCEGWHITLLLWLGILIIYVLTNYWVGFWVLKLGVSRAGNLRQFLRAVLKMFSSVLEPVRHVDTFSSFLTIQRDWSGCRWVSCDDSIPSERELLFRTISANNAVTPHLLLCFLSFFSVLEIAFRLDKACPLRS